MKSIEQINKELDENIYMGIFSLAINYAEKIFYDLYEQFEESEYYKGEDVDEEFQNYLSSLGKKDS